MGNGPVPLAGRRVRSAPAAERVALMMDLLLNAIVSGMLLGGFYAAVTVGVSISFGMLDIVNIAHPAFIILGSFVAYMLNSNFGIDPILAAIIVIAAVLSCSASRSIDIYHCRFERRGEDRLARPRLLLRPAVHHRGLAGADLRRRLPPGRGRLYRDELHFGVIDLPLRLLVPCLVSLAMMGVLQLFLSRTFIGRAIQAVAQDQHGVAADGGRIRAGSNASHSALSIATASVAGAILIIDPAGRALDRARLYRPRLRDLRAGRSGQLRRHAGRGDPLGIVENLTATFYGPSWSPAVAFGFLLLTLAFRPSGLVRARVE